MQGRLHYNIEMSIAITYVKILDHSGHDIAY